MQGQGKPRMCRGISVFDVQKRELSCFPEAAVAGEARSLAVIRTYKLNAPRAPRWLHDAVAAQSPCARALTGCSQGMLSLHHGPVIMQCRAWSAYSSNLLTARQTRAEPALEH